MAAISATISGAQTRPHSVALVIEIAPGLPPPSPSCAQKDAARAGYAAENARTEQTLKRERDKTVALMLEKAVNITHSYEVIEG